MPDRTPALTAPGDVLAIVRHPDPRLREACEPAALMPPPERERLAADMLATMYAAKGRGLAAPQVGRAVRMFVMDADWKSGAPSPLIMLDPHVLSRSDRIETAEEQCLSIPDTPVRVARPAAVRMRWFDLSGRAFEDELTGAEARIAQHEFDHLDGILIVDDVRSGG